MDKEIIIEKLTVLKADVHDLFLSDWMAKIIQYGI